MEMNPEPSGYLLMEMNPEPSGYLLLKLKTYYHLISVSPCAFRYALVWLKCRLPKKPL